MTSPSWIDADASGFPEWLKKYEHLLWISRALGMALGAEIEGMRILD
jgi:hypothetical protein